MKVLLKQDVESLGHKGDIKDVPDGYARNFLIRRGFAVVASEGAMREAQLQKDADAKRRDKVHDEAKTLAQRIDGLKLQFAMRVGEQDRLYGSVTSTDIADKIKEQTGLEVDRRKVELEEPIRSLGTFRVPIRVAHDLTSEVEVTVSAA
jgi:large subunit ribosomal protein L9